MLLKQTCKQSYDKTPRKIVTLISRQVTSLFLSPKNTKILHDSEREPRSQEKCQQRARCRPAARGSSWTPGARESSREPESTGYHPIFLKFSSLLMRFLKGEDTTKRPPEDHHGSPWSPSTHGDISRNERDLNKVVPTQ